MKITNIVAKTFIGPVDLDDVHLCLAAQGASIKRSPRFPGMFVRLIKGTCTIFSTGTVTINGTKSTEDLYGTFDGLKLMFNTEVTKFSDLKIVNVVGQFDLQRKVDLPQMHLKNRKLTSYNPEIVNAIHVHLSCHVLLHSTGKGIVTGGKSIIDLYQCEEELRQLLVKSP